MTRFIMESIICFCSCIYFLANMQYEYAFYAWLASYVCLTVFRLERIMKGMKL